MEAYNDQEYKEAAKHFEASTVAFYEAEELCRASCESEYMYYDEEELEEYRKRFHDQILGKISKTDKKQLYPTYT